MLQSKIISLTHTCDELQASSYAAGFGPEGAFDGNTSAAEESDGDGEYCSGLGNDDGWLQYSFSDLTCVNGYALRGPRNVSSSGVPGSWTLQGSVDAQNWK